MRIAVSQETHDGQHPRRKTSKTQGIQDHAHPNDPEAPGVGVAASYALPTRPGGMGRPHGRLC